MSKTKRQKQLETRLARPEIGELRRSLDASIAAKRAHSARWPWAIVDADGVVWARASSVVAAHIALTRLETRFGARLWASKAVAMEENPRDAVITRIRAWRSRSLEKGLEVSAFELR